MSDPLRITAIRPPAAIEGGRVTIEGSDFPVDGPRLPEVRIGGTRARIVYASPTALTVTMPALAEAGRTPVQIEGISGETAFIDIAAPFATGLHQVDNPVFDHEGNLYVTYSGTRGQEVPVSIFRVRPNGTRETFSSGIVNPTSMAIGPDRELYVSSRFEGTIYRVASDGSTTPFATDLGVACGLAFARDGTLFVGDRSGTIFRVEGGRASRFATLPASVAAFHLALAPDGSLYVTAPTLSSYDAVYRIALDGSVTVQSSKFGRPQGLAFDATGALFVVEALAGSSGLYRFPPPGRQSPIPSPQSSVSALQNGAPELILSGLNLVGVAFSPRGGLVVCSNETAYRLPR
jgi:sugar lactone lactonase YvrE